LIHCTRVLSCSRNRFFVYEHEPLSLSSYSFISHVFLSSISSSLPQVLCTSWVNYQRILEMILTLEPSCHFLRLLHSLLTMVVLLLLRVIAFCLCLSRQSQSTAWQGRADIDVSTSKSYCVLLRVFLWIPFSFLTYIFSWPSFLAYITSYMLAVTGLHSLSLIRHFLRTKINTVPSFGFLLELFESLAT
jgi:hypothetical protein